MSVKFNKKSVPDFIRITGIKFPVMGEISHNETVIPRRFGNIDNGINFGGKKINLTITLVKDKIKNIHTQSDELKVWLKGDNWKPSQLTFDEQPTKYLLARVVGSVDINDLFMYGESEIEFIASDPTKYDLASYNVSSTNGAVNIPYAGMEDTPAVITVTVKEACNNLNIKHTQTGFNIRLIGAFKAGAVVLIDCDKKVVKVNGAVTMKLLAFESRWIYLSSGTNTITVTSEDKPALNTVSVDYKVAN
ncbi:MAG: distal tail protein Dit [Carnobacterium sp.]|uniref:distal tail protein Dit n=1 Tax=Carnobacterium sp. TaxID=48221 RepID=UPI003C78646A